MPVNNARKASGLWTLGLAGMIADRKYHFWKITTKGQEPSADEGGMGIQTEGRGGAEDLGSREWCPLPDP